MWDSKGKSFILQNNPEKAGQMFSCFI